MQKRNPKEQRFDRRVFLRSGVIFTGAVLAGSATLRGAENKESKETEVGPPEDLMREHGVLKRVLLIYGEVLRRIDAKQDFPPEALADAARIIRSFVEDYHEKLEEDFLFPRFEKANLLVDLVKVLRTQHQAGRQVTDVTMRFANQQSLKNESEQAQLITSMQQFIRMYNPHEPGKTRSSFPLFAKSFLRMSSMLWAKISRKKKMSFSATTDLRRWWTRSLESKSGWVSTTSFSLRQSCRAYA